MNIKKNHHILKYFSIFTALFILIFSCLLTNTLSCEELTSEQQLRNNLHIITSYVHPGDTLNTLCNKLYYSKNEAAHDIYDSYSLLLELLKIKKAQIPYTLPNVELVRTYENIIDDLMVKINRSEYIQITIGAIGIAVYVAVIFLANPLPPVDEIEV